MTGFSVRASVALVCLLPLLGPLRTAAQTPSKPSAAPANELDTFMEKVLKRREFNRQTLEQYVLDETEQIEVLGPSRMPLFRQKREFTWYVRDGLHVRSPVKFDGVNVGDEARQKYEEDWARRERSRLERRKEDDGKKQPAEPSEPADPAAGPQGATPIPTPRFVSEAYFMEFKFEPGNYYLVGREQIEGKDVLRIEYYPKNMFNDDDEKDEGEKKEQKEQKAQKPRDSREARRERELEDRIDRQMNKTALVTLWVDPTEHQIVKYHLRQRLDGFPAWRMARQDRRHQRVDDDGPALSGRVAASRHERPRRHHAGERLIRSRVPTAVRRLQAGGNGDEDQDSEAAGPSPTDAPPRICRQRRSRGRRCGGRPDPRRGSGSA